MCDIGLIGLAVMGENLVLNFESKGFKVAVHNRTTSKIDDFLNGRAKGKNIEGANTIEEFVEKLAKPRKCFLMVQAGKVVDIWIQKLLPLLEDGDIIIDGGNSLFTDTNRRVQEVEATGKLYVGSGVSGGEEGALKGPSIMPGGSKAAWPAVQPMLQKIAAQVEDGPCCDWLGDGGAGHYVKMVHNGIEYGDMELICEAYFLLQKLLGCSNEELHDIFAEWNKGDLDSYLIEITRDIFTKKDEIAEGFVVDKILDKAGQKGTGKWTVINSLELGMPLTLVGESVFARCLSAQKDERVAASTQLPAPSKPVPAVGTKEQVIEDVRKALFASKIVSYAQGFVLIKKASDEYGWNIDLKAAALMWRGGCIIRSAFLGNIRDAFAKNPELPNLMLDDYFKGKITGCLDGWRRVCSTGMLNGIPCPAFTAALGYYDGYRCDRLPHNLLQAQRDYFGAHNYQRVDKPREEFFHTNWTGRGGSTASSTYNV